MKHYEFWFIVGSQTLYGEDVLTTVANRAEEMAQKLSAVLPYPLKYKVTAKSSAEITQVVKEANYDDSCAGIVTWCHTFSPSKMRNMSMPASPAAATKRSTISSGYWR